MRIIKKKKYNNIFQFNDLFQYHLNHFFSIYLQERRMGNEQFHFPLILRMAS